MLGNLESSVALLTKMKFRERPHRAAISSIKLYQYVPLHARIPSDYCFMVRVLVCDGFTSIRSHARTLGCATSPPVLSQRVDGFPKGSHVVPIQMSPSLAPRKGHPERYLKCLDLLSNKVPLDAMDTWFWLRVGPLRNPESERLRCTKVLDW